MRAVTSRWVVGKLFDFKFFVAVPQRVAIEAQTAMALTDDIRHLFGGLIGLNANMKHSPYGLGRRLIPTTAFPFAIAFGGEGGKALVVWGAAEGSNSEGGEFFDGGFDSDAAFVFFVVAIQRADFGFGEVSHTVNIAQYG